MIINFIVPEISRTGGMRIIFEYANRLTAGGHDVVLYTPNIPFNSYMGMIKPYFIKYRIRYAAGRLLNKNKLPDKLFKKVFEIKHLWILNNFTVRDADVIVATSWTSSYIVSKLDSSKGKKLYLIQDYEKWNSNIEYVNKSYTLPLKRITVSEYLKDLLQEKFRSDSEVIPYGIDFNIFNNPDKVFNERKQILFMDHLLENKNSADAIDTVKKLKEKYPSLRIKCFGIRKYHSLPEYIEFIEDPDDEIIAALYRESDIFLFTSKFEGFGLPPAESMACKCALAGYNVAAVPMFAENMKSAILTSPDKPDELLKGVEFLLNNEEELRRISIAGHDSVRKILDWDRSADIFESIIKAK
jgi:glycosyltransferase involved in cell wall biosynthesis